MRPLPACRRAAAITAALLAGLPGTTGAALPSPVPEPGIVTDGPVWATAVSGSTLYLGGAFTLAGPRTGPAVTLDPSSGALNGALPEATGGTVRALIGDGAGGWYLGGDFTAIGGVPRDGVAHVRADRTVDLGFDVFLDGPVYALALDAGRLYIGGRFHQTGGLGVDHLIAVEAATGLLTAFHPDIEAAFSDVSDASVTAILPLGDKVIVGGHFVRANDSYYSDLAELRASDGATLPWGQGVAESLAERGGVDALALQGQTLYVGGTFVKVGDALRRNIAAVDLATGAPTAWAPQAFSHHEGGGDNVAAVLADGGRVLIGGDFDEVGGIDHANLAAVDAVTGQPASWAPGPDGRITTLRRAGSTIYAGGDFRHIAGATRRSLAALDAGTLAATALTGAFSGAVDALVLSGGTLAAGGDFAGAGLSPRSRLAAVDLGTGQLTDWAPTTDGDVDALAAGGGRVFAGGSFQHVDGAARPHLVALDPATGAVQAGWNPGALDWSKGPLTIEPTVKSLVVVADRVYLGGFFTSIGATAREDIARLAVSDGTPDAWAPAVDGEVREIDVDGPAVYAVGSFSNAGGAARGGAAAFRASDGAVTAFDLQTLGVLTLAPAGASVYAGGYFSSVRGVPRPKLAQVSAADGSPLPWAPDVAPLPGGDNAVFSTLVRAILPAGDAVFAGGLFEHIGGLDRSRLAALDPTTGAPLDWAPDPGPTNVHTLYDVVGLRALPDGRLLATGMFQTGRFGATSGLAIFGSGPGVARPMARATLDRSGALTLGSTATCHAPAWTVAPAGTSVTWLRDRVEIGSGATHRVDEDDVGHEVTCRVTASPGGMSADSRSLTVDPMPPALLKAPVMSGDGKIGSALSCDPGSWANTVRPLTVAWIHGDPQTGRFTPVPGAVGETYVIRREDSPGSLACQVTAHSPFGDRTTSSNQVGVELLFGTPAVQRAPAISGPANVGGTLTCSDGLWTGQLPFTYTYEWLRDGAAIAGATRKTYIVQSADAGHRISCRVTATNRPGSGSATSAPVTIGGTSSGGSGGGDHKTAAPRLAVTALKLAGARLKITVHAASPGRLSVAVRRGERAAGHATHRLRRPGTVTVVVRLPAAARHPGTRLTVQATLVTAAKGRLTARRTLVVPRSRPRS